MMRRYVLATINVLRSFAGVQPVTLDAQYSHEAKAQLENAKAKVREAKDAVTAAC